MERWAHQVRAVDEVMRLVDDSEPSICLTSPTGSGKTQIAMDLIERVLPRGWKCCFYTNRRIPTEQFIKTFSAHGIPFGVMAAEYPEHENPAAPVQICSVQTVNARVFNRRKKFGVGMSVETQQQQWGLFHSHFDIWDEAHANSTGVGLRIRKEKHERYGTIDIGMTATPLEISPPYTKLVVAATNAELLDLGVLLPAHTYAPDEPDLRHIKRQIGEEYTYQEIKKVWTQQVVGRVIQHYQLLNPDRLPAIGYAPGVKESLFMAQTMSDAGIKSAHIDGNDVWVDGQEHPSSRSVREDVIARLRDQDGDIKIVWNRFLLRESLDIPELYHCILATPIGSTLSYIQIVGRVLRSCPGLDHVVVQDHGGNYSRHGSANASRAFQLWFGLSSRAMTQARIHDIREGKEPEPIACVKCGAVRLHGRVCASCGHMSHGKSRNLLQTDGRLIEQTGDIYKSRKRRLQKNTEQIWVECLKRIENAKRYRPRGGTFSQAMGLFAHENYYWPPLTLRYMPTRTEDWWRRIKDVSKADLH